MTWASTIAAVVGAATTGVASSQALKRQDKEAAQGILRSQALARQGNTRVNQEIAKVKASNPDAERAAATSDYLTALQKAGLTSGGPALASPTGAASGRFAQDVSSARASSGADARGLAGILAQIDAPELQRTREAQSRASTASDLEELNRQATADQFLTRLRASAIQPNPLLTGIGQGISAFGSAYAGRTPGGGPLKEIKPVGKRIPIPAGGLVTDNPGGTTTYFGGP